MNALAAESVQDCHDDQSREGGQQRSAQSLIDAGVDHVSGQVGTLPTDFPNSVEDDDGVVQRITHDRQQCSHNRKTDLELLDQQEAEGTRQPGADSDRTQRHEDIMDQGNNRRQAKNHTLKSDPNIDHDPEQTGQQRRNCLPLHLTRHLTANLIRRWPDRSTGKLTLQLLQEL